MEHRIWHDQYDQGVPRSIDYPQVPLFDFLERNAENTPDKPCTLFKGAKISYQKMNELTDRLAGALHDLGVRKGDRVGILIPNTPQFVIAYFGVLKAGGIVVATNPQYTKREIKHQVNDSGLRLMLLMSNFYLKIKELQPETGLEQLIVTNMKEALPPLKTILFTLLKEKSGGFRVRLESGDLWLADLLRAYQPQDRPELIISSEDRAIFQYSGGTTGIPKAAVGLHRNLVANSLQLVRWITSAEMGKEVVMMAIPLYHVYGMVAGMSYGLASGSTLVMVPDPRDLGDLLRNLEKYRATIFPAVPALYNAINNHPDVKAGRYDLSSLKTCISGSAPLMRETKETFEALTGAVIMEGYGLSEAPTATHCNPNLGENRTGSIGLPLPDVDAKIIDLEDESSEAAPGELGELIIKAPQVFKGYHNMPSETRNALRNGWLYTGDIVRMDEAGFFYIVDRKKEVINPAGFQVWPREVEEIIQAHPAVLEVAVAGVPDPYRGETVKAWVVVKPGETLARQAVIDWCADKLVKYKVPTEIEFRKQLPKTHVGKTLRRKLVQEHIQTAGG